MRLSPRSYEQHPKRLLAIGCEAHQPKSLVVMLALKILIEQSLEY